MIEVRMGWFTCKQFNRLKIVAISHPWLRNLRRMHLKLNFAHVYKFHMNVERRQVMEEVKFNNQKIDICYRNRWNKWDTSQFHLMRESDDRKRLNGAYKISFLNFSKWILNNLLFERGSEIWEKLSTIVSA